MDKKYVINKDDLIGIGVKNVIELIQPIAKVNDMVMYCTLLKFNNFDDIMKFELIKDIIAMGDSGALIINPTGGDVTSKDDADIIVLRIFEY
jgi:hypothetical protein